MRIALFGATGSTGKFLIEEALRRGHRLSVYTRDASRLEAFNGHIDVVVGDLQDKDAIATCLRGCEAVISALGPNGLKTHGDRPVMHGLLNIIATMKSLGIRRLVQISTAAYRDPNDGFAFRTHVSLLIFKLIAPKGVEDIIATAQRIAKSDLDWTLVRVPNLKDGPAAGTIDIGWYGTNKLGMKLSRGNLAKFLIDQVDDVRFVRAAPGIADH